MVDEVSPIVIAATLGAALLAALALRQWRGRRKPPRPPRFDLEFLAKRLGMSVEALRAFEPRYREQHIEKRGPYRSSKKATRELQIPSPDTMQLQRTIHDRILRRLRVHGAVHGFENGCSVAKNASMHSYRHVVLKLDLVDFFGQTKSARIESYFRFIGWNDEAAATLTRLTTHEGSLPQGAPTSPALSNRVNFALDHALQTQALQRYGCYTRYADDITVSFLLDDPQRVRGMIQAVRSIAKRYGYEVHSSKKLRVLRRHQSQQVTGLVVNEGPRVPRKTRRWLRAVEHRMKTGGPATLSAKQLAGWKAFQTDVDQTRASMNEEMRSAIIAALASSRQSLTGAAARLQWPLPTLKARMKRFGLWDDKSTVPHG